MLGQGLMSRPSRNADLHGNAPDTCAAALLLVDVINDLEFEGGEALLAQALPVADRLAALSARARAHGIPVVYVNDNFGRWRSDLRRLVRHCLQDGVRGRPLAERLAPAPDDYVVLKPKHSGFYSTTLDTLLDYLGAETLIVTGFTADACVLFTAADAYIRDYRLCVPADGVASLDPEANRQALAHMARVLRADVRPTTALDLPALGHRPAAA
jgi:nicotinamidase-related amidase